MKKILRDPSMWVLLASNIFILQHYINVPGSIYTVIMLFWVQSVLIGIFNVLDIFTVMNIAKITDLPMGAIGTDRSKTGLLFLSHYGVFHAVYFLFIKILLVKNNQVDWGFIELTSCFIAAGLATGFIRNKMRNRAQAMNLGNMFLLPYARILPMHFVILVPAFLNISAPLVFIILKIIADVLMYVVFQNAIFVPNTKTNLPS